MCRAMGITEKNGSSPHTRGAQKARRPRRREDRIIPAYAGSTYRIGLSGGASQDHPRIRGEHSDGQRLHQALGWIIPAYAGSTESGVHVIEQTPDHPRIRGEHADPGSRTLYLEDHPRIRGEHFL